MKESNWIVAQGKVSIDNHTLSYSPNQNSINISNAIVNNSSYFETGEISFKIKFSNNKNGGCWVYFNNGNGYPMIAVGFNTKSGHLFEAAKYINSQWQTLKNTGNVETLILNHYINVKIKVNGSSIKFLVNEVEMIDFTDVVRKSQIQLQFLGNDKIIVENFEIKAHQPKAFIIMQFSEPYDSLYKEVIVPVITKLNLKEDRADEQYSSNPILKDIENSIRESSVVIADITPDNPNVFYEVGYSHAIGKPTILLCQKDRRLPFDVSGFRTLFYDNTIAGKGQVEAKLEKYLEAAI